MTRWAILLLVTFVALGLSPLGARRAMKYAVTASALVLAVVFVRTHAL